MDDIIAIYDEKCKEIIDNMDSVKQFKKDFNDRNAEIYRFKANNTALYKLLHPIKLIKNRYEAKRLKIVYDNYYTIYNRSVIKYVKEETGELEADLYNPTFQLKPNQMDDYVKSLNLKK